MRVAVWLSVASTPQALSSVQTKRPREAPAVSSCDSDGVTVRNGDVTWHDDGYVVNTVVVTGISSNCEGQDLMVTATDKDQQALETADSVTIEAPSGEDNSTVVSFANRDVAVDDLDGYTVAIVDHGVA